MLTKKNMKLLLKISCILVICWSAMFVTDIVRGSMLRRPVFAFTTTTADDGGSGTYHGLGYRVDVIMYMGGIEVSREIGSVSFSLFNRDIFAFTK